MEHRTVASCVWVSCVILIQIHVTSQLTLRHRTSSRNISKRAVVFPETNTSGHSLPVFPDPVVEYVGREPPLAPPADKFGRPFCIKKAEDTFCEKVENYPNALAACGYSCGGILQRPIARRERETLESREQRATPTQRHDLTPTVSPIPITLPASVPTVLFQLVLTPPSSEANIIVIARNRTLSSRHSKLPSSRKFSREVGGGGREVGGS
ncbi:spaetzle domain-containing protein [Trichonephila clavipes]|nr:spaetzle domain-containing protein [Trichonephila clavipes]